MHRYQHEDELIISLSDSYYFLQKAHLNNLKTLVSLIVASYGVKSSSFEQIRLTNKLRLNIGQAIFPSNDIFAGNNYPYDIQLEGTTNKKYLILTLRAIYSNYQPHLYESSNYVLENPGISIEQTNISSQFAPFTSFVIYDYSIQGQGVSGEPNYILTDKRPFLSIFLDKPFNLSLQEDEDEYSFTEKPYEYVKAPIFYGLEKVSFNANTDYYTNIYAGYFLDWAKDSYSINSFTVPLYGVLPLNNFCIAPMIGYDIQGLKKSADNCDDYKEISFSNSYTNPDPAVDSIQYADSHKTPFYVIYSELDPDYWPLADAYQCRQLITMQMGDKNQLINTSPSGINSNHKKYYPLLFDKAQINIQSFNHIFELTDSVSENFNNVNLRSPSNYKAVINCTQDNLDANDSQRWYFTTSYPQTVFTLTTPNDLDGSSSYKTYISRIKLTNYSTDNTHGTAATLFVAGKNTGVGVDIAAGVPFEDEASFDGAELLISANGAYTVPFYIVEDSSSGEDYLPFNGYIEVELKFSK